MKKLNLLFILVIILSWSCSKDENPTEDEFSGDSGTFKDARDDQEYNWVRIGDQIWMAENLNATIYSDGTPIPLVEDNSAWDALEFADKAYCYLHNSTALGDIYGVFYTWAATMNGAASSDANPSGVQGVCPDGWHLPSDEEWKQLEMYLGMSRADADDFSNRGTDEGGKLKEEGTSHWDSPNTGATNSSGFTALPSSIRSSQGVFYDQGSSAAFWSSTESNIWSAEHRRLFWNNSTVYRQSYSKEAGFSIRCVKD